MRVTVCFGSTRVIVPCKGGATVAELVTEACARYKRAIGQSPRYQVNIRQLEHASDGGILDLADYIYDVAEDRDQLNAIFDEESDRSDRYNGIGVLDDSGSDGHRSPHIFQGVQSSRRLKAPTGNATVIKHEDRKADHEVNVGADAMKSGSNCSITVRGHKGSTMRDDDRIKSPLKKNMGHSNIYNRSDSGIEHKDYSYASDIISSIDHQDGHSFTSAPEKPEKNHVGEKPHIKIRKYNDNFIRGGGRQSIMGPFAGDCVYEDDYEDDSYQVRIDQYLPPPPDNPDFYPRFYNDAQETFVDIDERKLGIEIRSYKEKNLFLGLMVESVQKGGRSDREGLLQEGDIIVEINNHVLAHYNYHIAQELFKDAMKSRELQLRVYPHEEREREISSMEQDTNESPLKHKHIKSPSIPVLSLTEPSPNKPRALSSAKSLPNLNDTADDDGSEDVSSDGKLPLVARMSLDTLSNNTRKIGNMFEIQLKKGDQGLGFSITTRDTQIGGGGPIYVKNILPKGAAIQDGRLRAGDRLLQVNNVDLTGHTQESAVNVLRGIDVGSTVKLVVSRHVTMLPRKLDDDPVADKTLSDAANREYFQFEIALNDTGSAGLGISLKGNQSKKTKRDLGIFVKSVFHGGAAYQDGRLKPNDQLITVNGQSLIGMTNHEAIDTLRTSMSTVGNVRGMIQMVIARRKASSAEPLSSQFSSEASSEISDTIGNERGSRSSFDNGMEDDHGRYSENLPHQIDLSPFDSKHRDGDRQSSDPDFEDPNGDPFSRESIFRQSISEKRKGAASRDTQNMDIVKVLKNKQLASEKVEKKLAELDSPKRPSSPRSTPVKWVKPSHSRNSSASNSTPSKQLNKADSGAVPIPARRNLNNSSNLPVLPNDDLNQIAACCALAPEGYWNRRYLSPPYRKEPKKHRSPLTARDAGREPVEREVQVGPTLGIAKSSSLESLQSALRNLNEEGGFPKAQPRVLRGRVLNESFRAALDQPYDVALNTKPMATQEGNGSTISPLAKTDADSSSRTQDKKRAPKGYKLFGIFKVGKNKRSASSDRNLDSNSSPSSSPRLAENEAHKKYLEAKREEDFRKHQEENERIQAKAKEMRERQEQQRKLEDSARLRSNQSEKQVEDRFRAPSVPITAMQRMTVDTRVSYTEASGRRSVDPTAMRNSQSSIFDWNTAKRPTSPVDYQPRSHRQRKSGVSKHKATPDYSSLPRKPGAESNAGALQNDSDGVIVENEESDYSDWKSSYMQTSPGNGTDFDNLEFYNTQKPPSGRESTSPKQTSDYVSRHANNATRKGRSDRQKSARVLNHSVSTPAPSNRSKTPQPYLSRREDSPRTRRRSDYTANGTTDFATIKRTFQREQSPEPPPVVMRRPNRSNNPAPSAYRHSMHVDNPASRSYERGQTSRNQRPSVINNYWRKTRSQTPNHDHSDSDQAISPSASTVEMNRNAVKKIYDRTRYGDNIVISQPYNL